MKEHEGDNNFIQETVTLRRDSDVIITEINPTQEVGPLLKIEFTMKKSEKNNLIIKAKL